MQDKSDEELFEYQRKRTERTMKIAISVLVAIFAYVLFYLVKNG